MISGFLKSVVLFFFPMFFEKIRRTSTLPLGFMKRKSGIMFKLRKNNPHYLAKICNVLRLTLLLKKKPELVNNRNTKGETPLHLASEKGFSDIVELLLSKGADIDAKTEYYWTPLYAAVFARQEEVAKLLIMKGADVRTYCENTRRTVLAIAEEKGLILVADLIIEKGADINSRDNVGATPLHIAAWNGQTELVKMLVSKGADVNAKDNQIKRDNRHTLRMWHSINPYDGIDPEVYGLEVGFTPLDYAL